MKYKVYFQNRARGAFDKTYITEEIHTSKDNARLRALALNWDIQNIVEMPEDKDISNVSHL